MHKLSLKLTPEQIATLEYYWLSFAEDSLRRKRKGYLLEGEAELDAIFRLYDAPLTPDERNALAVFEKKMKTLVSYDYFLDPSDYELNPVNAVLQTMSGQVYRPSANHREAVRA